MEDGFCICIVGLGLMGGSLALALRVSDDDRSEEGMWPRESAASAWHSARIVAVTRNQQALAAARAANAIDDGGGDLAAGVSAADVIVLATPVRTIMRMLAEVGQHARPGALVLDLGSTKSAVCAAMAGLPDGLQPVGGHPMCGKETAGFAAAEAGLFRNRPFVLCPLPRTQPLALQRAESLARAVGGRPIVLDPAIHDRAVAGISHLPYALAVALVRTVEAAADPVAWSLASSGFRDTSRLAASDADMMLDILLTNREAVVGWLDACTGQLSIVRDALAAGDETTLRACLAGAQTRRAGLTV